MPKMRKGWYVKQSFDNDFTHFLEDMYEKYGEEVFSIQGIANKHMDLAQFSENFFARSTEVAEISVDGNANVKEKNISQYNYENNKSLMKLQSIYQIYKWIKDIYSKEEAYETMEKVISGEIFINDLANTAQPYCFAFDLYPLLENGMNFFRGNLNIKPPKRSESFIALVIQTTAYISNQIAGAVSYPSFFPTLNKFYEQEFGEDYMDNLTEEMESKIKNQIQNLAYSFNFPFRGSQSSFTNLSIMDRGFLKSLFEGYTFPDLTTPNLENTYKLSKYFFEYFDEINCEEGMFTFPVITLAVSKDEETGEFIDPDFVDWVAKVNSNKSLGNVFISKPTSFSSCCRLKNDYTLSGNDFSNSFGVGGLQVGSHRVSGLNLNRIMQMMKDDKNALDSSLDAVHKVLYAHRKFIEDNISKNLLPLYNTGWMNLKKQFSTIGVIALNEGLKSTGYSIRTKKGRAKAKKILQKIEDNANEWQANERDEGNMYNIEQIPGESVAIRLAKIDRILGWNEDFELYSNQYIPLIENGSIYDRFKIQGELDQYTSGGAILHLNVDDEKPLTESQYRRFIETAKETGTEYFAINYAYSEDENGNYIVGKHEVSPIDGSKIVQVYTRVVGFITPVSSWNSVRKEFEFANRVFYGNDDI